MTVRRAMLSLIVPLVLAVSPDATAAQPVASFDDIQFWFGSGTNRTALAIDWDGESNDDDAYVWGYRWDSSATGADLLHDALATDTRLFSKLTAVENYGEALLGIGYDQNDDAQFSISGGATFDERGIYQSPGVSDGEHSLDGDDIYIEGWYTGFWHIGVATQSPFSGEVWSHSFEGLGALDLTDGMGLSLAYTTNTFSIDAFAENLVAAPAAVSLLLADFNSDGSVNGSDLLLWQQAPTNATKLALWQTQFGTGPPASAAGALAVPEPASLILFCLMVSTLGLRKRAV